MYNYTSQEQLCIMLSYLHASSPKKVLETIEYFGDWDNFVATLGDNRQFVVDLFDELTFNRLLKAISGGVREDIFSSLHYKGIQCITIYSDNYPKLLANISDPPVVLFAKGDISLLSEHCLAIVGTRKASVYGKKLAHNFATTLCRHFVIVSGLAYGIDSIAHRATLTEGGKTIAVLAGGLDSIYPASHQGLADEIVACGGLLISENPPVAKARQYSFPRRNRIVSGISQGLLVCQAPRQSGTFSTVGFALEEGRDVFVVPGEVYDYGFFGSNDLIKSMQGAMVCDPDDILMYYAIGGVGDNQQSIAELLTPDEQLVVDAIGCDKVHFDQIVINCKLLPQQVNILLANLQLRSIICKLAGNIYCLHGGK